MTFDNVAFEKEAAAEEASGMADFALIKVLADGGAGDNLVAIRHGGKELRGEIVSVTEFAQGIGGAGLAVAEAEVVANNDGLGVEPFDDNLRNKFFRGEMGEVFVERKNKDAFGACFSQEANAVFQAADHFRHAMRGDEDCGMGMKGEGSGVKLMLARVLAGRCEQSLVTAMNAVEVPNGEGARAEASLGGIHGEMNLRGHARWSLSAASLPMGISKPS